ncbi:MAG: hypothetical protein WC284_18155, partial [Candidimonas sp.]
MNDKPFCTLPFTTIEMRVNGKYAPCCKWRGDIGGDNPLTIFKTTPLEAFQSRHMDEIRNHFLTKQEFLPECSECELAEKSNILSMR